MNTKAKTFADDFDEAFDELDREYFLGAIDCGEWSDRRDSHIAWFAERGHSEEPDDEAADQAD